MEPVNVDAIIENADWPKRTDDRLETLLAETDETEDDKPTEQ